MKKVIFFLSCSFLCNIVFASDLNLTNYDLYKKGLNQKYSLYKKDQEKNFSDYKNLFQKYKEKLLKEWGKYAELPSKTSYVFYRKNTKEKVDFQNRKIEILVRAKSDKELKKRVLSAFNDIKTLTIANGIKKSELLSNLAKNKKDFKNCNVPIIDKKYIDLRKISIKKLQNNLYKISLEIPQSFYLEKAKKYKSFVSKMSSKFDIPVSLIYAIIETESAYNPLAVSRVPAYGLMQIVPTSAGQDIIKTLYKKDYVPTPGILFNPKYNIFIGSAYLGKIYYVYFKNIKNPISRLYLTIAAYNTGPGNVAKTFTGVVNLNKLAVKVNSMSEQKVYNHLLAKLPYLETKDYLKKVKKRIIKYQNALDRNLI